MPLETLVAGRVGRPHGLDGSFYVDGPLAALLTLGGVVTLGQLELEIVRRAGTDSRPIVRLAGFEDREAAASLRGAELLVVGEAPELGEDEWRAEELEGCTVRDGARRIGVVGRLLGLPSCECLEVVRDEPGRPELLVPMVHDAIRSVDVEQRQIDVDLAFLGEE
jgi:16S rRNA processing protein RimM